MRRWLYAAALPWLCVIACSDRATIGALCPADCAPRASDGVCDCGPGTPAPATSSCLGAACSDAGAAAMLDACVHCDSAADGGEPTCTRASAQLTPKRADLLVLVNGGASVAPWWPAVREGFKPFIADSASRGLGLGLQLFGPACDAQAYLPPLVPIAPLPDNRAALEAALASVDTNASNSTLPAIDAAEQYAQRWSLDHPAARSAVVLITDGSPGGCDGPVGNYDAEAARLVQAARASDPAIATYVVGVGSLQVVESIARAGGTQLQRIPIVAAPADVTQALRAIRDDLRSCELGLPNGLVPEPGEHVLVTGPSGSPMLFTIGQDSAACAHADFFVSQAAATTSLIACPQRCSQLEAAQRIELAGACEGSR